MDHRAFLADEKAKKGKGNSIDAQWINDVIYKRLHE